MTKYYECTKCGYRFEKENVMCPMCPICGSQHVKSLELKPRKKYGDQLDRCTSVSHSVSVVKQTPASKPAEFDPCDDDWSTIYSSMMNNFFIEIINKSA